MLQRDPINTTTLQKKFPEIYRDFFLNHDLVVSTNADVPILHDNNSRFRGVAVKQKTDCRVYVGISSHPKKESTFTTYGSKEQQFHAVQAHTVFHALPEGLQQLQQALALSPDVSLSIDILSEAPQGFGMGVSSKLAVLIPLVCHLYCTADAPASSLELHQMMGQDDFKKKIQDLAYPFMLIFRKGDLDVSGMGGFHKGHAPDFYIYPAGKSLKDTKQDLNRIELGSLQQQPAEVDQPGLDYYLLFTGKKSPVQHIQHTHTNDQEIIDQVLQHLPAPLDKGNKRLGLTNSLYEEYRTLLYNLSFAFWVELRAFLAHALSADHFGKAVRRLDQYAHLKQYLESEGEEMKTLLNDIRMKLTAKGLKHFAVIRNGSFRTGGSISLVSERERGRDLIHAAIQELTVSYPYLELVYVSHVDGFGGTGFQVEKWAQKNIRSVFDGPSVLVIQDSAGQKTYHKTVHAEDLPNDIVLDTLQNKIYIHRQPVSYKELHSQRMTIDILKILVAQVNREVTNDELPSSSYAQNKNEIQSKIISPLTRLVQERTGKILVLTCKGSITNFSLKLQTTDVHIAIISAQ